MLLLEMLIAVLAVFGGYCLFRLLWEGSIDDTLVTEPEDLRVAVAPECREDREI